MSELTPAMKQKMAKLEEQADAVAEGREADGHQAETVSLSVMLGEGEAVKIGGRSYELAGFPVAKLARAGKLIAQCPDLMVSAALAAAETGRIGAAETTQTLNRLMRQAQPDADGISAASIEFALGALALNVSEEEAAAMAPLTVLALSRRHPELTEADIENDLDLETFLYVLCKILAHPGNRPLLQRF